MGVLTTGVGLLSISSSDRLVVLGANTINVASAALLAPLLGLTFVARHGTSKMRLLWILLIPPAIIVGLASGSRGPVLIFLAMSIVGAVRYLAHPGSVDWPRTATVAGAVLVVILVVSFASTSLPTLSTSRFASFGDFIQTALTGDPGDPAAVDTSAATRVALYGVAAAMFQERPILGYGTAGFEAMSNRLVGFDIGWPHDALLQFAAEFGLVGAALFVSLVGVALARRLPDLGRPIRVAFAYFLLQAMISGDIFSDRTTWGLLLLMLLMDARSYLRFAPGMTPARPEASGLATEGLVA
jgi:O-antigen ligase